MLNGHRFSLKNRFVVLLLAGILVALGVRAAVRLPLDAFPGHDARPDSDQHRGPRTRARGGRAADYLSRRVGHGRAQRARAVRSISKFGFSQVVAIFEDGTDIYFARQQVDERLARPSYRKASNGR